MNKKLNTLTLFTLGVALLSLLFSSTPSAMAVNFMWNNTGLTWNGTSSWVGGAAPTSNSSASTDTVEFGNMTANFNTVYLASNRTVSGATFDAGANAYTFTTDAVTPLRLAIGTSGIANNSTATQTFNLGVDLTQATSIWQSVAGGSLIFNNGIALSTSGSNRTLTIAGAGNFTANQTIANNNGGTTSTANAGVVIVTGTGITTFSGNNTYDGLTTMNAAAGTLTLSGDNSGAAGGVTLTAGTLNVNSANALGSGTLTLTAGTINNTSGVALVNAGNNSITLANNLTFGAIGNTASNDLNFGSGTVTAGSSRTLNLLGTGTTITMGSINNTSASASGATFTFNGVGNTIALGGLTIAAVSPSAVNVSLTGTANITINGTISNGSGFANGLSLNGSGTTTFNGNNTYSGATTINSGTLLKIGSVTALGSTLTGTTVSSGSVLDMNGQAVGNEAVSISTGATNALTGLLGSLINSSANSASLSGAITLAGNTTVGAGNITLNGNIGESGGARRLTKLGTGLLTLAGANTYTGGTIIADGRVNISSGNSAVGTFTIDGSTNAGLQLSSLNSLASSANLAGSSSSATTGTLDLAAAGSYSMNQYLGNNMKFTNSSGSAATLNFTGLTNTITSSSGGSGGKSLINNSANLGITFQGALDIGSSAANTVTFGGVGNFTINGTVFNTNVTALRGLDKTGTGSLTLAGANTYNGGTTVNGGALVVNGSVGAVTVNTGGSLGGSGTVGEMILNSGGLLKPGNSPGTLTASSASWAASSTYQWQIDNATGTAGTNWDLFSVTSALDMSALSSAAKMNLVLESLSIANYSTSTSFSWVIAKAATFTGIIDGDQDLTSYFAIDTAAFNGGSSANLPNGGFLVVTRAEGGLRTLNLMAVPEPSTGALLAFGLGGLVVTRLLRRKQS